MNAITRGTINERALGYSHCFKIPYTDLNTTAGLTKVLTLLSGVAIGDIVKGAAYYLPTPFVGAGITSLKIDVGYNLAAGADVPTAFLTGYELATAGTAVLAGDGNGPVFATLRTGYAFKEGASLEALFTAVGANLTTLTVGEVWVALDIASLSQLR